MQRASNPAETVASACVRHTAPMDPETKRLLANVVDALDAIVVALEIESTDAQYPREEALRRVNTLRKSLAAAGDEAPTS